MEQTKSSGGRPCGRIKTAKIEITIEPEIKDMFMQILRNEGKKASTEIPAIIREDDDRKNREIALIENMQREDLNAYEKALGIKTLMDEYGLTQEQVSKTLGKARSSIANSVRVLNLSPDVLEFVKEGKLSEGHCKALRI